MTATVTSVMGLTQAPNNYSKLAGYDRNGNGKTTDDDYYGVLYGAHIVGTPAIILENSFHTNLKSAKWLYDDNNLKKLAVALADTLATYYGMNKVVETPKEEVKPVVEPQKAPTSVDTIEYKVVSGDTLSKIALKYNTTKR